MDDIALSRFTGFAELYDTHRPKPSWALCDLLLDMANMSHANVVVDLGSGTGLSSKLWECNADTVIGVEPNDDMRSVASASILKKSVLTYRKGSSYETGLPDGFADIVTCSQSFHWMEPESTLAEVARVLRPGGVFAAYDNDWPTLVSQACDDAYHALFSQVRSLLVKHRDALPTEKHYPKDEHLANISRCGHFAFVKEAFLHNTEKCDSERFVGLALSQGSLQTLLKNQIAEIEPYIEQFRHAVEEDFRNLKTPEMWVMYRVRFGVKTMITPAPFGK